MSSFVDDLKKLAEDLELERRAAELTATAEQVFSRGLGMAGDFAHEHAGDVEAFLDKAGGAIDERTDGRFHDQWQTLAGGVTAAWGMLAAQRTPDEPPDELEG
ncbi:MAG: antitoxin [Nocardioidaceae bacterium]